jgi:hypothetical protein
MFRVARGKPTHEPSTLRWTPVRHNVATLQTPDRSLFGPRQSSHIHITSHRSDRSHWTPARLQNCAVLGLPAVVLASQGGSGQILGHRSGNQLHIGLARAHVVASKLDAADAATATAIDLVGDVASARTAAAIRDPARWAAGPMSCPPGWSRRTSPVTPGVRCVHGISSVCRGCLRCHALPPVIAQVPNVAVLTMQEA